MKSKVLVSLSIIFLVAILFITGCSGLMERLTPAEIPTKSLTYIGEGEQSDHFILGNYTSLYEARKIRREVLAKYRDNQYDLKVQMQKDKFAKQACLDEVDYNIENAEEMLNTVMNGSKYLPGVPGSALALLGLLGGGRFIKRPGDVTKEEYVKAGKMHPDEFKKISEV